MISKELLSLLGYGKVVSIESELLDYMDMQLLVFKVELITAGGRKVPIKKMIAIEVIASKCKEWAIEQEYVIVEAPLMIRISDASCKNNIWEYSIEEQKESYFFKPDYTFKACQWVLNQKDNK